MPYDLSHDHELHFEVQMGVSCRRCLHGRRKEAEGAEIYAIPSAGHGSRTPIPTDLDRVSANATGQSFSERHNLARPMPVSAEGVNALSQEECQASPLAN